MSVGYLLFIYVVVMLGGGGQRDSKDALGALSGGGARGALDPS
jgi:hypothetical protein